MTSSAETMSQVVTPVSRAIIISCNLNVGGHCGTKKWVYVWAKEHAYTGVKQDASTTRGRLVSAAISPYFSLIHYWPTGSYRIKSPACPDMRENFFGWVFSD